MDPDCCACGLPIKQDIFRSICPTLYKKGFDYRSDTIYCSAEMIEEEGFDSYAWLSLYRMIVKNHGNDQQPGQYWLSGVALFEGMMFNSDLADFYGEDPDLADPDLKVPFLRVPRARNNAIIKMRWLENYPKNTVSVFLDGDPQSSDYEWPEPSKPQKYGHPIHTRCWSFIERLIGPEVEKHLETFVEAIRQRFDTLIDNLPDQIHEEGIWHPVTGYRRPIYQETIWIDPFQSPELDHLLRTAVVKKKTIVVPAMDERGQMVNKRYKTRYTRFISTLGRSPFDALNLPLEIQYLILNHLDHRDIAILHKAFTGLFEWRLPDSYWIQRVPRALSFEVEYLRNIEDDESAGVRIMKVDWEYFCLQVEELFQTSGQLKSRHRIVKVIEGTGDLFFRMINKK